MIGSSDDVDVYLVIVNDERQYSLWPAAKQIPGGWKVVYTKDSKQNCLDYVRSNWTDMRPRSLKQGTDGN